MNLNQINKHLRPLGVIAVRGEGYYYWLDAKTKYVVPDALSVYVYRASHIPLDQWIGLAKEAAKCL